MSSAYLDFLLENHQQQQGELHGVEQPNIPTLPGVDAAQNLTPSPLPTQPPFTPLEHVLATAAAPVSAASSKARRKSASTMRMFQIESFPSPEPRVVKVSVTDLIDGESVSAARVMIVIGIGGQHAALGWRTDHGDARVDIVDVSMLPGLTLKQIKSATALTGANQLRASEIEVLGYDDFEECNLNLPTGRMKGFVCIKTGPLYGTTCDATMMESLVLMVSFWKRNNGGAYMFHVKSEPLDFIVNFISIDKISFLSKSRGRVRETNHSRFRACMLGDLSRRPFGNRIVAFPGAGKLIAAMMDAAAADNTEIVSALELTRLVLGAGPTRDIGSFVVCANQQSAKWGETVKCFCHVEFYGDTKVKGKDLQTRTRCKEAHQRRSKSSNGKGKKGPRGGGQSSGSGSGGGGAAAKRARTKNENPVLL
jgi:uncharacterized membrane protein YgcG